MATNDSGRLDRLLNFRRDEEERARLREARAIGHVEAVRDRIATLELQLSTCRACLPRGADGAGLIDAQRCVDRLCDALTSQRRILAQAEAELAEVRAQVVEAGRRRLAVERLVEAAALDRCARVEAASQADLDESGRLRALREGS